MNFGAETQFSLVILGSRGPMLQLVGCSKRDKGPHISVETRAKVVYIS